MGVKPVSTPPLKYLNQRLHLPRVRDRAACHGCTGRGDGANDVGPPGEILGGFSFLWCRDRAADFAARAIWLTAHPIIPLLPQCWAGGAFSRWTGSGRVKNDSRM